MPSTAIKTNTTSSSSSWISRALTHMQSLHETHSAVTGEEVRFWLRSRRMKPPAQKQSYGALINAAIRTGILTRTKQTRITTSPTSHSWSTPVYKVKRPRSAPRAAA